MSHTYSKSHHYILTKYYATNKKGLNKKERKKERKKEGK